MDFDQVAKSIAETGTITPKPAANAGQTDRAGSNVLSATRPAARPAPAPSQFVDADGLDQFDHQMMRHRAELESLDNQIANLDVTIDLEQQKLRESKASLDRAYHARVRLMHLRNAMVHFVQELQEKETL